MAPESPQAGGVRTLGGCVGHRSQCALGCAGVQVWADGDQFADVHVKRAEVVYDHAEPGAASPAAWSAPSNAA